MKHTPDQDLLLISHHSLGLGRTLMAWLHMSRCPRCRKRLREFAALSATAATALRVGLPAWKPVATALRLKILIAIMLAGIGIVGAEVAITHTNPFSASGESCSTTPGQTKATPVHIGKHQAQVVQAQK